MNAKFLRYMSLTVAFLWITQVCWAASEVATNVKEFSANDLVGGLSFNPNDDRIAVVQAGSGDELDVWSWKDSPHIVQSFRWPTGTPEIPGRKGISLNTVRYSPDGKLLAYGHSTDATVAGQHADVPHDALRFADVAVRIYDANTGVVLHEIKDRIQMDDTFDMDFSSDGELFARAVYRRSGEGHAVEIYRTKDWSLFHSYLQFPFTARHLALNPTRPILAVAGEYWSPTVKPQLVIIDLAKSRVVKTVNHIFSDGNQILSLAWSADGKSLGLGTNIFRKTYLGPNAVIVLDESATTRKVSEVATEAAVSAFCFSPNGRYLVEGNISGEYQIWDGAHKVLLQRIPAPTPDNAVCAFSKDSKYLALSEIGIVSIWRLN